MLQIRSLFEAIQTSTWVTVTMTVIALMLMHATLHWIVKLKARREQDAAKATQPPESSSELFGLHGTLRTRVWNGMSVVIAPLALLIWVRGLHFVVMNAIGDLEPSKLSGDIVAAADLLQGIGTLVAIVWLLARIGRAVDDVLRWFAARTATSWDDAAAEFAGRAARVILPLIAIILGTPALTLAPPLEIIVRNAVSMVLIAAIAFLLLQLINTASAYVIRHNQIGVSDNRRARAIYTQVLLLRKIVTAVIVLVAVASMLMVFDSVRHFGTALIASAGVAGIIVGFAAQKSIATLLAGFQIALTQPIRIDDVVIVESEWGQIEEITLTYVVVRLWDLRRLILPITYFIEKPFQNWTRTSADLIGSVFLYVDYRVPLTPLREEFQRILDKSSLWDRKVAVLQVTDTKQHTVELRALVSAKDAGTAWDLRCEVREKLITYLQREHPESLPRLRMSGDPHEAEAVPLNRQRAAAS
jgi:small-conductance mechanosensitive channel